MAYSEAQRRATEAYRKKHKEKTRYQSARSSAKSFIRNRATLNDLDELARLIAARRKVLKRSE